MLLKRHSIADVLEISIPICADIEGDDDKDRSCHQPRPHQTRTCRATPLLIPPGRVGLVIESTYILLIITFSGFIH